MTTYKIVRFYAPHIGKRNRAVKGKSGLTLKQAQEYCQALETRKEGEWFCGYVQDGK